MNKLKNFKRYYFKNTSDFFLIFCNNFYYKNFKLLNNLFFQKNKKILIQSVQLQQISSLNKIVVYVTNYFFLKKNNLFNVKNLNFFIFFKKISQKLNLIYFKKEKDFLLCGFLGLSSVLISQQINNKKIVSFEKFVFSLNVKNESYSKFFLKKQNRFFLSLLSSNFLLNRQFQILKINDTYNVFSNALNLSKSVKLILKCSLFKKNMLKSTLKKLNINNVKQFFFLKKKRFNSNFY